MPDATRTVTLRCTVSYKDWQIDPLTSQFVRALESTVARWPEVAIDVLGVAATPQPEPTESGHGEENLLQQ